MIFLLNDERVFIELINLSRLKLAEKVGVKVDQIKIKLTLSDSKCVPEYEVTGVPTGMTEQELRSNIAGCYDTYVAERLSERLGGIKLTWEYYDEKNKATAGEITEAQPPGAD